MVLLRVPDGSDGGMIWTRFLLWVFALIFAYFFLIH